MNINLHPHFSEENAQNFNLHCKRRGKHYNLYFPVFRAGCTYRLSRLKPRALEKMEGLGENEGYQKNSGIRKFFYKH